MSQYDCNALTYNILRRDIKQASLSLLSHVTVVKVAPVIISPHNILVINALRSMVTL